jgi:hypothetical protein
MPSGSDDRVKAGKDVIEHTNNRFNKVKVEKEKKDTRQDAVGTLKTATGKRGAAQANREAQREKERLDAKKTPAEVLAAAQARKKKAKNDD